MPQDCSSGGIESIQLLIASADEKHLGGHFTDRHGGNSRRTYYPMRMQSAGAGLTQVLRPGIDSSRWVRRMFQSVPRAPVDQAVGFYRLTGDLCSSLVHPVNLQLGCCTWIDDRLGPVEALPGIVPQICWPLTSRGTNRSSRSWDAANSYQQRQHPYCSHNCYPVAPSMTLCISNDTPHG